MVAIDLYNDSNPDYNATPLISPIPPPHHPDLIRRTRGIFFKKAVLIKGLRKKANEVLASQLAILLNNFKIFLSWSFRPRAG